MKIADALAAKDEYQEQVPVPEWGGTIRVQSITGKERCDLEKMWPKNGSSGDARQIRIALLSSALRDDDGSAFGTPEQIADLIDTKNAVVIERLVGAALRVCGFNEAESKELEKN